MPVAGEMFPNVGDQGAKAPKDTKFNPTFWCMRSPAPAKADQFAKTGPVASLIGHHYYDGPL